MKISDLMRRDCASQRQRDIAAVCDLADRMDLAPEFLMSDLSLSDVLHRLVQIRTLDQMEAAGAPAWN